MDILHVVGGSGDQRFCRERSEVRDSELVDSLIHFLSDTGDGAAGGRAGYEADNDLDRRHHDRADDHIQAIPPDLGYTVLTAVLHSAGQQADVAYDLHHEENFAQRQQKDRDD